jgi:hypothetical protein
MVPEGSLLYSQELSTGPYPELDSLGRLSAESIQVRGPLWHFITSLFF